ncbi:biotin-dependent carboxyltransferase family protein [Herbaspirillum lusitanum]|uniref:5-oxoprolinase subunit C family protein n=1 Tax=Herbaspirillum lusitanum TaxID=213312 RepID=UPI00035E071E|nr:biotin-dependent carboxyltransferase family protein [Herbaspirillum lusitanum]
MSIVVIKPGALTTFQDLGRFGSQHIGVPVSGVMDERAHRLASMLVGNSPESASLEVTLMGPTMQFLEPAIIAVCGADLGVSLNGNPFPLETAVQLSTGSELSFGRRVTGLRAYIAVAGGFVLPLVMGSTSTYVRGGFGGAHGKSLQKGDRIEVRGLSGHYVPSTPVHLFPAEIERYKGAPIRIVPGREWNSFEPEARQLIVGQPFRISPKSDRMGCRLEGAELKLIQPMNLQSEVVTFGTIQVPPDGLPIVLMADRQSTGGYPRIANVASVDLPRLAQMMAGETVTFEWITLGEAQRLAVMQSKIFESMEDFCGIH